MGAFVAALAFMLFFWSNFLHGTAGWLEVLLFLGGVFFLLLEMLVLPGFGIFGLGGGAMILASLVLASQTFVLPQSESELAELRHSLTIVAAATLCVVAAAIALRRYLPHAPVFRTLLLNPTPEEELVDLDYRESLADFSHLVGQQGVGHDESHAGRQGRVRRPAGRRHRRRPADRPRAGGRRHQGARQSRAGAGGGCVNRRAVTARLCNVCDCPAKRGEFSRAAANSWRWAGATRL